MESSAFLSFWHELRNWLRFWCWIPLLTSHLGQDDFDPTQYSCVILINPMFSCEGFPFPSLQPLLSLFGNRGLPSINFDVPFASGFLPLLCITFPFITSDHGCGSCFSGKPIFCPSIEVFCRCSRLQTQLSCGYASALDFSQLSFVVSHGSS